jgi:hypothetical protein
MITIIQCERIKMRYILMSPEQLVAAMVSTTDVNRSNKFIERRKKQGLFQKALVSGFTGRVLS